MDGKKNSNKWVWGSLLKIRVHWLLTTCSQWASMYMTMAAAAYPGVLASSSLITCKSALNFVKTSAQSMSIQETQRFQVSTVSEMRIIYKKVQSVSKGLSKDLGFAIAAEQVFHLASIVVFVALITVDISTAVTLDPMLTPELYRLVGCHVVLLYALLHHAEGLSQHVGILWKICINLSQPNISFFPSRYIQISFF